MKLMSCSRAACLLMLVILVAPSFAQASLTLPLDPAGMTAFNEQTKSGYTALGKIQTEKDFEKKIAMFPALIAENKDFVISDNGNANVVFAISSALKKNHPDPKTFSSELQLIDESYKDHLPSYAFGYFASRMAPTLLKNGYPEEAKRYAAISVALFNESDCTLNERYEDADRAMYEQKKSKTPIRHVYYEVDGVVHCAADQAARLATLGKIEAKLGDSQAATANFNAALKIHPTLDAYVGLAAVEESAGDKPGELRSLTAAYLTGRLEADEIAKSKALYLEMNPGSSESDYATLADAAYAKTFSSPVKEVPAPAAVPGSQHVVLDELFTGADCEPCTAPDLAAEAALERYSREQFVLVVYHNNAPSSDPLTNDVGEARAKFYATEGSTPHTFLDGKEVDLEEGLATHAQVAYDQLSSSVDKLLSGRVHRALNVVATRNGGTVEVTVTGGGPKAKTKTHLQILLLENPVSYSGRNTLRFHPMVVRASAQERPGAAGFSLLPKAAIVHKFTFSLPKIEKDNYAYYEKSKQALVKRLSAAISSGAFDKKEVEKMGEFHEHKNLIDPNHLAIVAFLQDDATKRVITATYLALDANARVATK